MHKYNNSVIQAFLNFNRTGKRFIILVPLQFFSLNIFNLVSSPQIALEVNLVGNFSYFETSPLLIVSQLSLSFFMLNFIFANHATHPYESSNLSIHSQLLWFPLKKIQNKNISWRTFEGLTFKS
jgi:hypothetical protein